MTREVVYEEVYGETTPYYVIEWVNPKSLKWERLTWYDYRDEQEAREDLRRNKYRGARYRIVKVTEEDA